MLVRRLAGPFGAEVIDLDRDSLSDLDVRLELRDALFDNLVLVIRKQRLGIDGQVHLTQIFGEPEFAWDKRSRHPEDPHVQIMESHPRPTDTPPTASQFWHTDGSFLEAPPIATFLAIIELPDTGGDTLFVDTRSAFESLSESEALRARGLQLRYSYRHQLYQFQTARYGSDDREEFEEHPDVLHPLVRRHPATGRGSLYLDQLCAAAIEDLSEDLSREILERLYAHTIVPERSYRHRWSEGDLLVWDNPSLMHRRGENHQGRRLLYRTTAAGADPVPL